MKIPTELTPIAENNCPIRVGVNSFGAGGTNVHLVIEGYTGENYKPQNEVADFTTPRPFVFSAKSKKALEQFVYAYEAFLIHNKVVLSDFGHALLNCRSRYPHNLCISACNKDEIMKGLELFKNGEKHPTVTYHHVDRKQKPRLAFVFSGQGGQWAQMGMALYNTEPTFRKTMDMIDEIFQKIAGWSILNEIRANSENSQIAKTRIVQPAIMSIQVALARLFIHYGVKPEAVVGHSIGEVAAAHISGALCLEKAVYIIYHRSNIQDQLSGKGRMLAIGTSEDEAKQLISDIKDKVSIAAINGPTMITLSGDESELLQIAEKLEQKGQFNRFVRVDVPYHSHYMEQIRDELIDKLSNIKGSEAIIPLYSTVDGKQVPGTHIDGMYWYRNVRQPVLMTQALEGMCNDKFDFFIEVGPHPVLVSGVQALLSQLGNNATACPSMHMKEPEEATFISCIGKLIAHGWQTNSAHLFGEKGAFLKLPKHPWSHKRFWFEMPDAERQRKAPNRHPFLKEEMRLVTENTAWIWQTYISLQSFPFLKDHQVDHEVIFPATGHIELAYAVAAYSFSRYEVYLENLQFDSALILSEENPFPPEIRLEVTSNEGDYSICSQTGNIGFDTTWHKHSSGRINYLYDQFPSQNIDFKNIFSILKDENRIVVTEFYKTIREAGLNYGIQFQCIQELWHDGSEVLARLTLPTKLNYEGEQFNIHPSLLDACLHAGFVHLHKKDQSDKIYLPYRIDRVKFYRKAPNNVWAYLRVLQNNEQFFSFDTWIFNENQQLIAEVQGTQCKMFAGAHGNGAERIYDGCYEYHWVQENTTVDKGFNDIRKCIIVSPHGYFTEPIKRELETNGITSHVLILNNVSSSINVEKELLANLQGEKLERRTFVLFVCDARQSVTEMDEWTADSSNMSSNARILLTLAQIIIRLKAFPKLGLVTFGSAGIVEIDDILKLDNVMLHGMMRVIRNECPNMPSKIIDLSINPSKDEVNELIKEILALRYDKDDFEIALRGTKRYLRQLLPVKKEAVENAASQILSGMGGYYQAELLEAGMLDNVVFRQCVFSYPNDREIEIEVQAAALNFKDIVNIMGILPERALQGGLAKEQLGFEVAGSVVRCGQYVTKFKQGDEVLARVSHGFAGRVIIQEDYVVLKPEHLTPQQAACIPVAYLTAYYSLNYLAKLQKGETVLIHSAAGGVGIAAIRLAQMMDANIIATSGTKAKRDFIRELGVKHVFDSRSLNFYNQVMKSTNHHGVDVVLNSLTGNHITQSIKCLAPFGRFVEIGKADIYKNAKLNMERMGQNISFFVVDIDRLAAQKPVLHRQILGNVVQLFNDQKIELHEISEFPISKLVEALKFLSRSTHVGKIIVKMEGETVKALPAKKAKFRSDASYVITGGASGFGLEIAKWLVQNGAKHLVLVSRSGCKSDADRNTVNHLRKVGINIHLEKIDITNMKEIEALFERFGQELPEIRGIVHGAGLLEDASIVNMDEQRFMRVFAPKALGAWNLHQASVHHDNTLDFFMMLSSISSVLGLFGQINYASANFFLDSLAASRHLQSLPATSVNLGVLGEYAGMSKMENDTASIMSLLESHGMPPIPLNDILYKLEAALNQHAVQRMTANFDWKRFTTTYPHLIRDSRFEKCIRESLAKGSDKQSSGGLRVTLLQLDPKAQQELIGEKLAKAIARILDVTADKISLEASIDKLALDSLALNQFRNWILRNLDINYPMIKLLKGPSVREIVLDLISQFQSEGEGSFPSELGEVSLRTKFVLTQEQNIERISPWLIRCTGMHDASTRLFCFHSMGTGAELFTRFLLEPPANTEIFAIQTPGREERLSEPAYERIEVLVDKIISEIFPWLDKNFVIWGHSFGGIVAYEVIRSLQERHKLEPQHFMVTGTVAPSLIHIWQKREVIVKSAIEENTPEYLISLLRYVENAEFITDIFPIMRKDMPLLMNYRYKDGQLLNCPITAFGANQDDLVYLDEIAPWKKCTKSTFNLNEVDGDHWFLNSNREVILRKLNTIISQPNLAST